MQGNFPTLGTTGNTIRPVVQGLEEPQSIVSKGLISRDQGGLENGTNGKRCQPIGFAGAMGFAQVDVAWPGDVKQRSVGSQLADQRMSLVFHGQ